MILYNNQFSTEDEKKDPSDTDTYIYESADDLDKKRNLSGIRLHAASGVTRCLGSALDAGKFCGYDYRPAVYKGFKTAPRVLGDNDNVVDAWDMLNAANNTEAIDIIYDKNTDGPLTADILNNLPLYAFIGTGDARGKYISKDNENIISRHGIINLGFTKKGKPIIYDLGKLSEGVPEKYLSQINYIAVPSENKKYFNKDHGTEVSIIPSITNSSTEPVVKQYTNTEYRTTPRIVKQAIVDTQPKILYTKPRRLNVASSFIELLNSVFT